MNLTHPLRRAAALCILALSALLSGPLAHAQALSDWSENNFIDQVFRGQTWTLPGSNWYVGLSLNGTGCTDSSIGTEASGGNYARQAIARSTSGWANTQNSGSGASTGTGGATSNLTAASFGTVTWTGSVSHFFVADASSGGNMLFCQSITGGPKTINSGDTVSFSIGAITFTIQ